MSRPALFRSLAAALAFASAPPAAALDDPVPADIAAQLAGLKRVWSEVPEAGMRDDWRFEYSGGRIWIGRKRLAEVTAAPENRSGVLLAFLLGHEAWHAVQTARVSAAELGAMRRNRMMECEADFMGGAAAYRFLAAKGLDEAALEGAHNGLTAYVRTRTDMVGEAATYLTSDRRVEAIGIGWGQARSPALIRYEGRDAAPPSEAERASETCRKLAGVGDGSIGLLDLHWASDIPYSPGPKQVVKVTIRNRSPGRAIVVDALVPAWLFTYRRPLEGESEPPRAEPIAYDVLDHRVVLPPGAVRELVFEMRRYVHDGPFPPEGYRYSFASFFNPVSARYAAPLEPVTHCMNRIAAAGPGADRDLLMRVATIAMSARDDFESVAGEERTDGETGFSAGVAAALRLSETDMIHVNSYRAYATLTLRSADEDAPIRAEYARMRSVLETLCGRENVGEERTGGNAHPEDRLLTIRNFAPKAGLSLNLWHWRDPAPSEGGSARKGGTVTFVVDRAATP